MILREKWSFSLALAVSLLLHLGILFSGLLKNTTPQKLEHTPLTVKMQSFALNTPVPAKQPTQTPLPPQSAPDTVTPSPTAANTPPAKAVPEESPKGDIPPTAPLKDKDAANPTAKSDRTVQAASETLADPLYLPDGSLNLNHPQARDVLNKIQKNTQNKLYAQNLDTAAAPIPDTPPIKVKNVYDIIAPPDNARPPFPTEAQLRYEGPFSITGSMSFHRNSDSYRIEAVFNVPFNKMRFLSEGKIEGNKLIPLEYTDTRKDKLYASALFDYDNKIIRYGKGSAPDKTAPINGAQHDFFSWAWQMSIDGGYMPGYVQLTNGKKIYEQTSPPEDEIELAETDYDTGEGKIRIVTQNIDRERQGSHDSIAYGFAPDFANIPALIIFNDGGREYQMHIIGIKLDGHDYWQALRQVKQGNAPR